MVHGGNHIRFIQHGTVLVLFFFHYGADFLVSPVGTFHINKQKVYYFLFSGVSYGGRAVKNDASLAVMVHGLFS